MVEEEPEGSSTGEDSSVLGGRPAPTYGALAPSSSIPVLDQQPRTPHDPSTYRASSSPIPGLLSQEKEEEVGESSEKALANLDPQDEVETSRESQAQPKGSKNANLEEVSPDQEMGTGLNQLTDLEEEKVALSKKINRELFERFSSLFEERCLTEIPFKIKNVSL